MQAEIEKVKKRREERALEKAQHEEEMVIRTWPRKIFLYYFYYTLIVLVNLHYLKYCSFLSWINSILLV